MDSDGTVLLVRSTWRTTDVQTPSGLSGLLADTRFSTGDWHGLAFTTAGPVRVRVGPGGMLSRDTLPPVDPASVYELRAWRHAMSHGGAQEFRWLAGTVSAVLVETGSDLGDGAEACLVRDNAYLLAAGDAVKTLEVFVADPRFGNMEPVDELVVAWGGNR